MNSTLDDIRNNHPNDAVGMAYFSYGDYGKISVPVGQEWGSLKSALFYPQSMIDNGDVFDPTKEFRAFGSDANTTYRGAGNIPNAQGGTDPNTGLAMAYNMLSPSTSVPLPPRPPAPFASQTASRNGRRGGRQDRHLRDRRGAQLVQQHQLHERRVQLALHHHQRHRPAAPGNGNSAAMNPAYAIVDKIVEDSSAGQGGLSTGSSPRPRVRDRVSATSSRRRPRRSSRRPARSCFNIPAARQHQRAGGDRAAAVADHHGGVPAADRLAQDLPVEHPAVRRAGDADRVAASR